MSTPALRFDGVGLVFDTGTRALEAVDLSVEKGEFISIVGPSGCGKSTLLRIAAGLESQTEGTVTVDDASCAFVFQDPTLLPWRTVLHNAELLGELSGMSRAERRERAIEALKLVGLEDAADALPRTLSGGMRMRASLARALVMSPELYLFDEPFAALDEMSRASLNDELLSLFERMGFTGLFVTHSIQEAVYLSSRVIVMSGRPGRVLADIPISFSYPRSPELRFEAAFAAACGEVSHALRSEEAEAA